MEAQRTKQDIRFLKGRQIAYIDFHHFKISGTGETLNDFDDLLRVQLKKDKVQGFDTKWDKVLLSMSKFPTLHYPQEFKHLIALYLQDTVGEQRTFQLCTTETSGLLVCGADYKGQKIQCPQRRQVSSGGGVRNRNKARAHGPYDVPRPPAENRGVVFRSCLRATVREQWCVCAVRWCGVVGVGMCSCVVVVCGGCLWLLLQCCCCVAACLWLSGGLSSLRRWSCQRCRMQCKNTH